MRIKNRPIAPAQTVSVAKQTPPANAVIQNGRRKRPAPKKASILDWLTGQSPARVTTPPAQHAVILENGRRKRPAPVINKKGSVLGWLSDQFQFTKMINTTILLGILGYIPGAWLVGIPLFTLYALLKQKSIMGAIQRMQGAFGALSLELAETMGKRLGDAISNNPISVLKSLMVLAILVVSGINSFSLVALYGIYAYTSDEWVDLFKEKLSSLYRFCTGTITTIWHAKKYDKSYYRNAALMLTMILSVYLIGILSVPTSLAEVVCTWIGFNAIFRDMGHALRNPLKTIFENPGKIIGGFWGYKLAYLIFKGKIYGSIGHPVGYLENQGIFASMFSSIIDPVAGFSTRWGFFNNLSHHIRTFINGIFTSAFVTQEAHLHGDFFGTVGPSNLQIFSMMAIGVLCGYVLERAIYHITQSMARDGKSIANQVLNKDKNNDAAPTPRNNALQRRHRQQAAVQSQSTPSMQTRYHVGFISVFTPLFLFSKAGASMVALCGGSVLTAAILTSTMMFLTYSVVNGIANRLGKNTQRPHVPAAAPARRQNVNPAQGRQQRQYTPALQANRRAQVGNRELARLGVRVQERATRPRRRNR